MKVLKEKGICHEKRQKMSGVFKIKGSLNKEILRAIHLNSERCNNVDTRFKVGNFTDRIKRKSKIQTTLILNL